ncbi:MAG TPA: hypothetical protein VGX48_03535 [Pyrinomonadaceae bacterium]|jgi:hypothetical protein|nr:hypothetical protein [Pyrinomonadaceae bacterium]
MKVKSNLKAGGTTLNHSRSVNGLRVKSIGILLVLSLGQLPVLANPRDDQAEEARKQRQFQTCMRPAELAYQKAIKEAQHNLKMAEHAAEGDYREAMRNAKSDAARTAAREAKRRAEKKAQEAARLAQRAALDAKRAAADSCRNPKPPEQPENNPAASTQGTLGHGPRGLNPSVRMDLRVVDGTGKPVQGVKAKLWSERQSNGFLCEAFHTTDARGTALMNPIHFNKTLQLKLEAKGFEPQIVQVDPSQLDRPFRAVMQAK